MKETKYKLNFRNPAMGIIPIPCFLLMLEVLPYSTSVVLFFAICLVLGLISAVAYKPVPPFMILTVVIIVFVHVILYTFTPIGEIDIVFHGIILEIIYVLYITIITGFRSGLESLITKRWPKQTEKNVRIMRTLEEFYMVSHMLLNFMLFHLMFVLIYTILPEKYHSYDYDHFVYIYSCFIVVFGVIIYEYIRLLMLKDNIKKEKWLPIVNEQGAVIGKVAQMISFTSGNRYLHPVIRVVLIHKGLLFLKERPKYYQSDPGKIDHPFEEYTQYREDLQKTVDDVIERQGGVKNLKTKFAFKYIFKNADTHRLIYLYTAIVSDEKVIQEIQKKGGGKPWISKQIEDNLGKGVFSDFFEKEYEILRDAILIAEKYSVRL